MSENERTYCKRDYAKELIQNGILNGFVAFYGNQIVRFCNSDIKDNYFRLSRENNLKSWKGVNTNDKILSIVCFIVAPDMRRKGIAKALLDYACRYAKENGFELIDIPNGIIARKKLKANE